MTLFKKRGEKNINLTNKKSLKFSPKNRLSQTCSQLLYSLILLSLLTDFKSYFGFERYPIFKKKDYFRRRLNVFLVILFIIPILYLGFYLGSSPTGFAVLEGNNSDIIDMPLDNPTIIDNETIETPIDNNETNLIETPIEENGTIIETPVEENTTNETNFDLDDVGVINDNETIETPVEENITIQENITNMDLDLPVIIAENLTENITEELTASKIIINEPVKWTKLIKNNQLNNLTTEIPSYAQNITVKDIKENKIINEENIEIRDNNVIKSLAEFEGIKEPNKLTGYAVAKTGKDSVLSKFLKWLLSFKITGYAVAENIDENSTLIINNIANDVEIEYYTQAPSAIEENITNGKRITINSDIHYENISAYTYLDSLNNNIKLYHVVDAQKEEVSFDSYDLNNDSYTDYIEWNVPSLSSQVYEVIIGVTKASHLDENKTLISDIYNEVKEKDDIWSEAINNNEYVRVTFEQVLDNTKDITIYARSNESAEIEVYTEDGNETLAKFENITNENYYKIYLTNLKECYDNETQILTEHGWKYFSELKDEKVMTLNKETGKKEFQKPASKQIYNYSGDIYKIITGQGNLLVSPEHKIYAKIEEKTKDRTEAVQSNWLTSLPTRLNINNHNNYINFSSNPNVDAGMAEAGLMRLADDQFTHTSSEGSKILRNSLSQRQNNLEFNLYKISDVYNSLLEKAPEKELFFLDADNNLIKVLKIEKVPYSGLIYDVDVPNDIVLVRRKNNEDNSNQLSNLNLLRNKKADLFSIFFFFVFLLGSVSYKRLKSLKEKSDVKCPECESKDIQKKGFRKNKREEVQKYQCKKCGRYFNMKKMLNKSYPVNVILNAISFYNKGLTLENASKKINMKFGVKTYPKLISTWMNEFSNICTFRRIRKEKGSFPNPVFEKLVEHKQPYLYKYHKLKLNIFLTDYFKDLKNYLLNIANICPHELFLKDNARSSQIKINEKVKIEKKNNYACELAELALKMARTNKERHEIVQDFMLVNDTSTLAVEVPIWLTKEEVNEINSKFNVFSGVEGEITGHIDIVQARYGIIYILDYKPEAEKIDAVSQLFTYALALSIRSGKWLRNFRCAWFDDKNYYEFNPNDIILNIISAQGIHISEEEKRKYILDEKAKKYFTSLNFHKTRQNDAENNTQKKNKKNGSLNQEITPNIKSSISRDIIKNHNKLIYKSFDNRNDRIEPGSLSQVIALDLRSSISPEIRGFELPNGSPVPGVQNNSNEKKNHVDSIKYSIKNNIEDIEEHKKVPNFSRSGNDNFFINKAGKLRLSIVLIGFAVFLLLGFSGLAQSNLFDNNNNQEKIFPVENAPGYLTVWSGNSNPEDTFDLKILGEVEIDYIVDPVYELSNITYQAELNNVVCEGGNEYCHLALNDSDIVLYMPFDVQENGNNVTYDFSSFNNDGTLNGMGSSDSPSGFNSTGGINETGGYQFDGVNDYVNVSTSVFQFTCSNFSVSLWANAKSLDSSWDGLITTDIANSDGAWKIYRDTGKQFFVARWNLTTLNYSNVVVNTWHNYGYVKDGTNLTIYMDGIIINSGTITSCHGGAATELWLGTYRVQQSHYLNGTIDEVMIFNRSLSANEIGQLYLNQFGKFYSQGNLTTNETTIEGKYSNVNLTIHSQNQAGADLNCSIYDGTSWQAYQNITNELPAEFNISSSASTTALNTSCIFIEDPYAFYTPILLQNITYETTNFANNIPTQSAPFISAELEVSTLGSDTSSNGLNETIVGYWKLNRYGSPDESSVLDETGVNNGTLSGFNNDSSSGPTYSGRVGSAFNFDGVNDYIDAGNGGSLNLTTSLSVFAWVKAPNTNNNVDWAARYDTGANKRGWMAGTATTNLDKFSVTMVNDGLGPSLTNAKNYITSVTAYDNTYHFVGFTFNGTLQLYVDGVWDTAVAKMMDANITIYSSNAITTIGSRSSNGLGSGFWNGSIDEVMIYNVSLSDEEVMRLYLDTMDNHTGSEATIYTTQDLAAAVNGSADADNDNLTSIFNWYEDNESLMVLNMPFDSNSTAPARDYSVYNNSGSLGNNSEETFPFWNSTGGIDKDIPGVYSGAYEFDGVNDYISGTSAPVNNTVFTATAWFKWAGRSGGDTYHLIVGQITGDGAGYPSMAVGSAGTTLNLFIRQTNYSVVTFSVNADFTNKQWHHIGYVYNGTHIIGYFDGNQIGTPLASTSNNIDTNPWIIGARTSGTDYITNGSIDEVQIYNRSLSSEEVYQLYLKNYNKLTSQETTKGKSYYSEVYVNDGYDDSTPYNTSEITILNSAPSIPVLNTPIDAYKSGITDTTINWYDSTDSDSDALTYYLEVANDSLFTEPYYVNSSITETTTTTSDIIPYYGNGTKYYRILANDGTDNSSWSDVKSIIFDTIPTQSNPFISAELETPLNETIVGYWKLNRYGSPDESSVLDETGVNNGTLSGFNNDSLSGPTFNGRVGSAFNFDGVNDYVNAGTDSSLNFNDSFTISAWVYPKLIDMTGNSNGYIFDKKNIYAEGYTILQKTNYFNFAVEGTDGTNPVLSTSAGTARLNEWTHIVAIRNKNNGNLYIYLNGNLSNSMVDTTSSLSIQTSNVLATLGRGGNDQPTTEQFNGTIDEVSIWNVSLSSDEIMQLYLDTMDNHTGSEATIYTTQDLAAAVNGSADADNDNLTSIFNWYEDNESLMVLNMPFDSNSTYPARDYSVYNNSGTVYGAVFNSTGGIDKDISGLGSGAYEFNGVNDYVDVGDNSGSSIYYTIGGWAYPKKQGNNVVVSKLQEYIVNFNTNNQLACTFYNSTSSDSGGVATTTKTMSLNTWSYVTCVNNGTNVLAYINGNLDATSSFVGVQRDSANAGFIGQYASTWYFNGSIDEVQIYNRSLSSEEIYQLYLKNYNKLANQETTKGKSYYSEVYVNDGYDDSTPYNTSEITILNSAPSIPALNTPADAYKSGITNTLVDWTDSTDADSDSLTYYLEVCNDSLFTEPYYVNSSITETTTLTSEIIPYYGNGTKYYRLLANDGTDNSSWSDVKTIIFDTIPTQSAPFISAELETPLNETIVGYWKLNRYGSPDESKVLDETGVNNGTLSGFNNDSTSGPTYSGRVGSAFNFDGVDDYIDLGTNANLNIIQDITISAWIKVSDTSLTKTIISKGAVGSANLKITSNVLQFRDSSASFEFNSASITSYVNKWFYVTATYDKSNARIYINGVESNSASASGNLTSGNFDIGGYAGVYFNGTIDEVSIYNVSLSDEEVMKLYLDTMDNHTGSEATIYTTQDLAAAVNGSADADNDNLTSIFNWYEDNESLMVLNMPFDSNSTYPARDYSVYNNSGSLGNNSEETFPFFNSTGGIDKDISGLATGAYEFDGVNDYIDTTYIISNDTNFTISVWAKWKTQTSDAASIIRPIISSGNPGDADGIGISSFRTGSGSEGSIAFVIYNETDINLNFNDNNWHHIVMLRGGSSKLIYYDGVLKSTTDITTNPTTNVVQIGGSTAISAVRKFNGTIDEVQIYNRSLSSDEIYQLYLKNYNKLVSQETTKGKSYYSEVYVNDGYDDSTPYNTSEITILNSAPSIPTLNTPIDGYKSGYIDAEINWYNSSDADSDSLTYYLEVCNDSLFTEPYYVNSSITETTTLTSDIIPYYGNGTKYYRVLANDGSDNSSWSDVKSIIFDTIPTQSAPFISAELETPLNETIVGYWKLNRYSDKTEALDETGANNGTLNGFDNTSLSGPTFNGRVGSAFNFDGVNDYISISFINGINTTNNYAMSAWIYPKASAAGGIIDMSDSSINRNGINVISSGGVVSIRSGYYNGAYVGISSSNKALNQWYHVVYVNTAGTVTMFINGVGITGGSIGDLTLNQNRIGHGTNVGYFNGTIDEVSIYNVSLSSDEISQLYLDTMDNHTGSEATIYTTQDIVASVNNSADADNDNLTSIFNWYEDNESLMVLNMPFDSNSTYPARDYSVYNNSGSLGNNSEETFPFWNSTGGIDKDIPGLGSGAYEFDGVDDYIAIVDNPNLDNTPEISVCSWIYPKGVATSGTIVNKLNNAYRLRIEPSMKLTLALATDNNAWNYAINQAGNALNLNAWNYVCFTYKSGSTIIYLNGINDSSSSAFTGDISDGNEILSIGMETVALGNYFNGSIDEVMIFNRSLSSEEVYQLYLKNYNKLANQETTKGKSYYSEVYVNDGYDDSLSYNTSEITILNTAPIKAGDLDNVTANEDAGNIEAATNSDLKANFSDADSSDNNNPTYYELVASTNSSTSCYFTGSNSFNCDTLANASGTDYYTISLNDSDGVSVIYDWQITVNAVNDAPQPVMLNLPLNNTAFITTTLELNWSNTSDVENDNLFYYLEVDNDSDFSSLEYVNSSITETSNTTSDTITLADGTYYWHVLSNDGNLNASEWSETRVFAFDTTPPSIESLQKTPDPSYNNDTVYLNATITDARLDKVWLESNFTGTLINYTSANGEVQNDNDVYYYIISPGNFTNQQNITYTWYANDTLGLENSSALQSFLVENRIPEIPVLTSPIYNGYLIYDREANFTWNNATDYDFDPVNFEFQLYNSSELNDTYLVENITTSDVNFTIAPSELPLGWYYWKVRSFDTLEYSNWSDPFQVLVDYATIRITSPENNSIIQINGNYIITAVRYDNPSWMQNATITIEDTVDDIANIHMTNSSANLDETNWTYTYRAPLIPSMKINVTVHGIKEDGTGLSVNDSITLKITQPVSQVIEPPRITYLCPDLTNVPLNNETIISVRSKLDVMIDSINVSALDPNGDTFELNQTSNNEPDYMQNNYAYEHNYSFTPSIEGTYVIDAEITDLNSANNNMTNYTMSAGNSLTFNVTGTNFNTLKLRDICHNGIITSDAAITDAHPPGQYNLEYDSSYQKLILVNATVNETSNDLCSYQDTEETTIPPDNKRAIDQFLISCSSVTFDSVNLTYDYSNLTAAITYKENLELFKCESKDNCSWDNMTSTYISSNTNEITGTFDNFSLFMLSEKSVQTVTTVSGGTTTTAGGGGKMPFNLKIIAPPTVTIYTNDKLIIPLIILNPSQDIMLNNINLEAISESKDIKSFLSQNKIIRISPGEKVKVDLTLISTNAEQKSYGITVKANVENPKFEDSVRIYANVVEEDAEQISNLEQQIEFAQQLFLGNPECAELQEYLTQARAAMENKEYAKSLSLAQNAIDSCRELFPVKEITVKKYDLMGYVNKVIKNKNAPVIAIEVVGIIIISIVLSKFIKKRKKISSRFMIPLLFLAVIPTSVDTKHKRRFNEIRKLLLKTLSEEKEITLNELATHAGVSWKTAKLHLIYLKGKGFVIETLSTPYVRIFKITEKGLKEKNL